MEDSTYKTLVNEMFQINEVSYKDYKKDDSKTSKKKINEAIHKVNSTLFKLEQVLRQNIKLKSEEFSDNDKVLWKTTEGKMNKIHNRMNTIFEMFQKLKSNK